MNRRKGLDSARVELFFFSNVSATYSVYTEFPSEDVWRETNCKPHGILFSRSRSSSSQRNANGITNEAVEKKNHLIGDTSSLDFTCVEQLFSRDPFYY
ncbi:hypothetical protein TWF594_011188 [Orbilia oligospora]|nr:hypothetical protein TWF594_011188 [Orbilia oligospora]